MYSCGQYFKTKCHTLSTGVCAPTRLGAEGAGGGGGPGSPPLIQWGVIVDCGVVTPRTF